MGKGVLTLIFADRVSWDSIERTKRARNRKRFKICELNRGVFIFRPCANIPPFDRISVLETLWLIQACLTL